jgi:hypothetical protein
MRSTPNSRAISAWGVPLAVASSAAILALFIAELRSRRAFEVGHR